MGVLQILDHPLQEAQGLIEHHRHRDLAQLLADAVLQHGPHAEVIATEHGHRQLGSGTGKTIINLQLCISMQTSNIVMFIIAFRS